MPQTIANLEVVAGMLKRYHKGLEQLLPASQWRSPADTRYSLQDSRDIGEDGWKNTLAPAG